MESKNEISNELMQQYEKADEKDNNFFDLLLHFSSVLREWDNKKGAEEVKINNTAISFNREQIISLLSLIKEARESCNDKADKEINLLWLKLSRFLDVLKRGYWYKNSKTDEPIIILEDRGEKVKALALTSAKNFPLDIPYLATTNVTVDKENIKPLEITYDNLKQLGFIMPTKHLFNSELKRSGAVTVKYDSKLYRIKKEFKGIHEIQERYNLYFYSYIRKP